MTEPRIWWLGRLDKGDEELTCVEGTPDQEESKIEGEGWFEIIPVVEIKDFDLIVGELKMIESEFGDNTYKRDVARKILKMMGVNSEASN